MSADRDPRYSPFVGDDQQTVNKLTADSGALELRLNEYAPNVSSPPLHVSEVRHTFEDDQPSDADEPILRFGYEADNRVIFLSHLVPQNCSEFRALTWIRWRGERTPLLLQCG